MARQPRVPRRPLGHRRKRREISLRMDPGRRPWDPREPNAGPKTSENGRKGRKTAVSSVFGARLGNRRSHGLGTRDSKVSRRPRAPRGRNRVSIGRSVLELRADKSLKERK